jgi:DNA-binding transcriptional LysR family regulator
MEPAQWQSTPWLGVEVRHFAALQAIAAEHSFARAAQRLGYTQSAVSQQIATLERIVGEQLIERPGGPRPVALTEAGALLLRHAESIVARLEAAQADLRALREGEIGVLSIGTFQSAGSRLLPPIMRRFVAQWPEIDVTLVELEDEEVGPAIERGVIDVGFVQLPVGDAPFETIELMRDEHVLVTPKHSPLAQKKPTLREIAREPLVGFREPHTIIDAFRAAGVNPEWRFRSNDNPTVQALVAAGIGIAVMPRLTVDERDPRVEIVDLPAVPPRIIALARHRDRYASPAMRAFIETAISTSATRPSTG